MKNVGRALSLATVLPAACFVLVGCEGGVETLQTLSPRISMEVCQPGGPCGVDAGDASTGTSKMLVVEVVNSGDADLTLSSVVLSENTDPAFTLISIPNLIEPGETGIVEIRFLPSVEGRVTGTFIIRSDAVNVLCDESTTCEPDEPDGDLFRNLRLDLSGTGVAGGAPVLTLDKVACDFGRVGIGASGACSISVGNDGDGDLILTEAVVNETTVAAGSGGDVFAFTAPTGQGIAPGTRASVDVTFYPDATGAYASVLALSSNDGAQPLVEIALTGEQVDAPTCSIRIGTVNNVFVDGVSEVEPLDDVVLLAHGSLPASAGATIDTVQWSWVERPAGSTLEFSGQGSLATGFTFADGVQGVDLAGHYRVAATVTDSLGNSSTNLCEVSFNAVPQENLLVQLGWEIPTGDMDLHLVRMDEGNFCSTFSAEWPSEAQNCGPEYSTSDCHFSNCTFGGLDWDQVGGYDTDGDPSLDIDDLCGYGPENITVPTPEPGQYLVAIHYWGASCGGTPVPVGNTVRIFLGGVLEFESYKSLAVDEWWEAAVVHWPGPGGTPCVAPMDQPDICN